MAIVSRHPRLPKVQDGGPSGSLENTTQSRLHLPAPLPQRQKGWPRGGEWGGRHPYCHTNATDKQTKRNADKQKRGRDICVYVYIYICAVKLKSGPRFGGFKVKKWSKFKVKKWSKFFFTVFPIFIVFFGHF